MDQSHADLPIAQGPPPTEGRRYTRMWMLAASALLLIVLGASILTNGSPSDEVAAEAVARLTARTTDGDSSEGSMSAWEAEYVARILAIISDAHSGRYFVNDFEDGYSFGMESALVQGMGRMTDRYTRPADKPTDEMVACMLSYVETTIRGHSVFPFDGGKVEPKATAHCTRLGIK